MSFASGAIHKDAVRASLDESDLKLNPDGCFTGLMSAALIGETSALIALLEKGVDANGSDQYGRTPLMEAAFAGHTGAVEALISRGADVNARDGDGWTALMEAASKGHTATVKVLLDSGADPYARNRNGWTVSRLMARQNAEIIGLIQSRL
ncbi:MAG TPA: ankyrin repeat domain-containing protein [Blastocatellia bacterium]|nr:ankyrin repeat domain-containing protein [Blastocatellia bacterium]